MRVLCDFLYCPYEQSFQWKWRNRGKLDYFMESTPFHFFDPQVSTQYFLKKWTNVYPYIYTYIRIYIYIYIHTRMYIYM